MIEQIAWTLDHRAIPFAGWNATMVAPGGFDRATGSTSEAAVTDVGQGAILTGWRPSGEVLWTGRLAAPPRIVQGQAFLTAIGPAAIADKVTERVFFMTRRADDFVPGDTRPFTINISEKFDLDTRHGSIKWAVPKGLNIAVNTEAGVCFWVQGEYISRFRATIKKSTDDSDYTLYCRSFEGPDGTPVFRDSRLLGGSTPSGYDWDVTIDGAFDDALYVLLQQSTGTSDSPNRRFWLTQVRVYGCGDDDTDSSEVVEEVANRLGWATDAIQVSGTNAMPLDWSDGSLADLADYAAEMDDWRWLGVEGDRTHEFGMEFGPWEKVWRVSAEANALTELEPMELFNAATVFYAAPSGQELSVTAWADPDPLEQHGTENILYADLSDIQDQTLTQSSANQTQHLAEVYAETLAEAYSTYRVRGELEVSDVVGPDGSRYPATALRAGDLLDVVTYQPTVPPQRVVSVEYTPSGVRATLTEEVSLPAIAAEGKRGKHKHKHRHKSKK